MCRNKLTPLFVYGTLIQMAEQLSKLKPIQDSIPNARMYSIADSFPAVVSGEDEDVVQGVIIYVDDLTLNRLDRYESKGILYDRVQTLTVKGRPVHYYMYLRSIERLERVESGVWVGGDLS